MTKYVFGLRFHDFKYFEVVSIFIFLEIIINLRAPIQNRLYSQAHSLKHSANSV